MLPRRRADRPCLGHLEDSEVQRSTTHSYQVRAYDETGNLGRMSAAVVVTHGDDTARAR